MSIKTAVYDYHNPKLGKCILLQLVDSYVGNAYQYSYIFKKSCIDDLIESCEQPPYVRNETLIQDALSYAHFFKSSAKDIYICNLTSNLPHHGFGTDILRSISMYANSYNTLENIELTASPSAIPFYKNLGFVEKPYAVSAESPDMIVNIQASKFADFSKFKFNPEISLATSEVLR